MENIPFLFGPIKLYVHRTAEGTGAGAFVYVWLGIPAACKSDKDRSELHIYMWWEKGHWSKEGMLYVESGGGQSHMHKMWRIEGTSQEGRFLR